MYVEEIMIGDWIKAQYTIFKVVGFDTLVEKFSQRIGLMI